MNLTVGQKAPEFTLSDQDGKQHSLSSYHGQFVLLYFYPKDDTPGCTKEACSLRDNVPHFENLNALVFGISKDSVTSHKKFADKFELTFPLLSDESTETIQAYDSWGERQFMGKKYMGTFRNSFLINPEGNIAKIYENVKPEVHAEEVVADIQALRQIAQ
ncbi:MAG: thioredoxin-dependent thiol peroxidase [bacterium]